MNPRGQLSLERLDPRCVLSGSSLMVMISHVVEPVALEGDPDQPIIVGRVYNDAQMPPYGLPGSQTASGWKSNSSPGGSGANRDAAVDEYDFENFSLFSIQQEGTIALLGRDMVLKGKKILQS